MKKPLSVLLLIVMLCQALPMSAFATVGRVLSDEELSRAYTLTGLGDEAGVYHDGMTPNASWNAAQLRGYLEDKLSVDVYNLGDTIARANCALAELEQTNSAAHSRFMNSGLGEKLLNLGNEAEALREEMRYYEKRLTECSGVIAEMGRMLKESSNLMFDSDKVRYSARIEEAAANLTADRAYIMDNLDAWEAKAASLRDYLQYGNMNDDADALYVGDALDELFTLDAPVSTTAKATAFTAANTRLSRLAADAGIPANKAIDVEVDVLSENQMGISFAAEKDGKRAPVAGLSYVIQDYLNPNGPRYTGVTNERGNAIFPSSGFTHDQYDCVRLSLRVDGEPLGYRSVAIDDLDLDLGSIYEITMIPLDGSEGESEIDPYLVSAEFSNKDIFCSDYQMLYSTANDYESDIKVEVAHAEGQPELIMTWYEEDGDLTKLKKCTAKATTHEGNIYIFRGPWNRRFSPSATARQRPAFSFGEGERAVTYISKLVSVRAATDKPINEGTGAGGGVFGKVLTKGIDWSFDIPLGGDHKIHVAFKAPFLDYAPKFNANPDGTTTLWIGSEVFADKLKETRANWQSKSLKELNRAFEQVEENSKWATYKAKAGTAYEFYKERRVRFLGSYSLQFGVFVVLTGRWQLDNKNPDVKTTLITVVGGAGFTTTFNLNIGWSFHIAGPISVGVNFTFGLSVGVGFDVLQLDFAWVNGEFQSWRLYLLKEFDIDIAPLFAAQVDVGLKGFLEAYVRFTATLDIMIRIHLTDGAPSDTTVTYAMSLTAGAIILFADVSYTWTFAKGQLYPKNESADLLGHYMNEGVEDNAGEKVLSAYQEPQDYPGLQPDIATFLDTVADAKDNVKLVTVGGSVYAFYLAQTTGSDGKPHWRVHWKQENGEIHSMQELYKNYAMKDHPLIKWYGARNDYAFDVTASEGYVFLAVLNNANILDEHGLPAGGPSDNGDYTFILVPDADGRLTSRLPATMADGSVSHFGYMQTNTGVMSCEFSFARVVWADRASQTISYFEFYNELERVHYDESQGLVYDYTLVMFSGNNSQLLDITTPDYVNFSTGGYHRVKVRTASCGWFPGAGHVFSSFGSMPFVALCEPNDGRAGDRILEYFDYKMNWQGGLNYQKLSAIALARGNILDFWVVTSRVEEGQVSMVFYVEEETNAEGDTQHRLKGLYINPMRGEIVTDSSTHNMELDVTHYDFDVTIPTNDIRLGYIGAAPYLYWWNASPSPDDETKTIWRIRGIAYDAPSNTMADAIVLAQFVLPDMQTPSESRAKAAEGALYAANSGLEVFPTDFYLTDSGTGYLVARALEKSSDEEVPWFSLYSFPERIQPLADLQTATVQHTLVKAGSYEDIDLGVMNTGNVPLTTIDIELREVDAAGKEGAVVETAHINLHEPEKSKITMGDGSVPRSGASVAHRAEDYDYSPRQRDFIHDQKTFTHKLRVGKEFSYDGYVLKDASTQHLTSDLLMPGSLADIMAAFKIPEGWSGAKKLRLRISGISIESNALRVLAGAAGLASNAVGDGNDSVELVYRLNPDTGKLELQAPALSNSALSNVIASGLFASEVEAGDTVDLMVSVQDLDVSHRVYTRWDGRDWLTFTVKNHAVTGDPLKLVCAVYVDGSDEPYYLNLPYYREETSTRRTHNFTLPLEDLVDDPDAHDRVRVVISAVDTEENANVNNEFTVYLGGSPGLRFTRDIWAEITRDGETVTTTEIVPAKEGETATLRVDVAGGTKPYQYQWQVFNSDTGKWEDLEDGGAISGANTDALTLQNVKGAWDGRQARCVVTDASGASLTSDPITLHVAAFGASALPDTGDRANLPLYLAVAALALAALVLIRRRRED